MTDTEQVEPKVRLTPGGWFATTPSRGSPRIGVMGATEVEAIANYRQSCERWKDLEREPDEGDLAGKHA